MGARYARGRWKVSRSGRREVLAPAFPPRARGHLFEPGDVLVAWARKDASDAHVLVVDAFDGATLDSWDYGQRPLAPALENAALRGELVVEETAEMRVG